MAAPSLAPYDPKTLLLDNDNDITAGSQLPTGQCNFTNLSLGVRCGCQRFWAQSDSTRSLLVAQKGNANNRTIGWCMCEHHACFHEVGEVRIADKPKNTAPDELAAYQYSRRRDSSLLSTYRNSIHGEVLLPQQESIAAKWPRPTSPNRQFKDHNHDHFESAPMGAPIQSTFDSFGLPPIPSQCLLPSNVSSGGFAGEVNSFRSLVKVNDKSAIVTSCEPDVPSAGNPGVGYSNESVTEVATPRGSPDLDEVNTFGGHITGVQAVAGMLEIEQNQRQAAPPRGMNGDSMVIRSSMEIGERIVDPTATALRQVLPHLQAIHRHLTMHPTLDERLQNHAGRIDLLENASIDIVDRQEVLERFDRAEEHNRDTESRIEEVERLLQAINDASSSSNRQGLLKVDDSNASFISQTSSAIISDAIGHNELSARLNALESQISCLIPSYTNPWVFEVIFLPFGSSLKGIWATLHSFQNQRSRNNSMAVDDWTQSQHTSLMRVQGDLDCLPDGRSWEDIHDKKEGKYDWLAARACAQTSKVEQRLRSRGLVQKIEVKGPDARDVQSAILAAFGDLPEMMAYGPSMPLENNDNPSATSSLKEYHGLQASYIPLRKLHKDSRLRFLDPAEMVTPAIWTALFLSNVAMRATGVKRLYMTHSNSYIQQAAHPQNQWTWQKIRELPRVSIDSDTSLPLKDAAIQSGSRDRSSFDVREADARERCWEWDERLDPKPSPQSSFTSYHSSLSIRRAPDPDRSRSSQESHSSATRSPILSTTPTSLAYVQTNPQIKEHHLARPLHTRTTSMPSLFAGELSPPQGKRRITSFDHDTHPSSAQSSPPHTATLSAKRQRTSRILCNSRSPSRPRDTPRWSAGPPSPYVPYDSGVSDRKRASTPFAYATPHSNAPYIATTGAYLDNHGSTTDEIVRDGQSRIDDFSSESDHDQEKQVDDIGWDGVANVDFNDDLDQERMALSASSPDLGVADFEEDEDSDDSGNDAVSETSSRPSEYPIRQPSARYSGNQGSFHIHVDEDGGHGQDANVTG